MREKLQVTAIQCKKCGDIVWSRAQHDFRECTCGAVAIDGGPEPHKFLGNQGDYEIRHINLDITEQEAYRDWNFRKDKYGLIHTDENTEFLAGI